MVQRTRGRTRTRRISIGGKFCMLPVRTSLLRMTTKTSPLIVKVKKELPSDEIKDFAETAMNELLGWYGYGNVDRNDLTKCSRMPTTTVHLDAVGRDLPGGATTHTRHMKLLNTSATTTSAVTPSSRTTNSTPERCNNNSSSSSPDSCGPISKNNNVITTAPNTTTTNTTTSCSSKLIDKQDVECGWCKRPVSLSSPEFLASPEGPRYCTESCFSQSRRASFKRAKTCDWCKHVRHAVSYVDFQDGASQLQFCSDKCLNQYKMQIFCKETQAHLDMNPHLKEKSSGNDGLITPDLWLRNCKSRSSSPCSDRSRSRSPVKTSVAAAAASPSTAAHKPLITVTPSSKLMSRPNQYQHSTRVSPKPNLPASGRKRRSLRLSASTAVHNQKPATSINGKSSITIQDLTTNAQHKNMASTKETPAKANMSHHFLPPPPNLYPLRHGMISPSGSHPSFIHPMQHHLQHQQPRPPHHHLRQPQSSTSTPSPQPTHIPTAASASHHQQPPPPTRHEPIQTEPIPLHQDPGTYASTDQQSRMFGVNPPPITILVPYPVIIPIPIPIPIPMPIVDFMRAAQYKMDLEKHVQNNNNNNDAGKMAADEPLDFTKTKDDRDAQTDDSHRANDDIACASPPLSQLEDMIAEEHHEIIVSETADDDDDASAVGKLDIKSDDGESFTMAKQPQQQRLPKFKITRLNARRIITASSSEVVEASTEIVGSDAMHSVGVASINVAESSAETSRPLRKRKRLVDCDYSRLKEDSKKK